MPTSARFTAAMAALAACTETDSASDRICAVAYEALVADGAVSDELILLAARFHYPNSPGRDRERQLAALARCGYDRREAKRFITLVESQRGLAGDPDKQLLAAAIGEVYLSGAILPIADGDWTYGMGRLWRCLPPAMQERVRRASAVFRDGERYPVQRDVPVLHSRTLGPAVTSGYADGCGFPDVFCGLLGHGIAIEWFSPLHVAEDELDRCIALWMRDDPAVRATVIAGLLRYKDCIAEACGEDLSHITAANVFDHLDFDSGIVRTTAAGLELSLGENCTWEPEHGVSIQLDMHGAVVSVGEVG